mmetsp:Transcript_17394/g.45420  ORF Transcript_17394/g.45420 Transcript_17394/m.45420 type:complete len:321 (+) Transcript_17394:1990-2952(+)
MMRWFAFCRFKPRPPANMSMVMTSELQDWKRKMDSARCFCVILPSKRSATRPNFSHTEMRRTLHSTKRVAMTTCSPFRFAVRQMSRIARSFSLRGNASKTDTSTVPEGVMPILGLSAATRLFRVMPSHTFCHDPNRSEPRSLSHELRASVVLVSTDAKYTSSARPTVTGTSTYLQSGRGRPYSAFWVCTSAMSIVRRIMSFFCRTRIASSIALFPWYQLSRRTCSMKVSGRDPSLVQSPCTRAGRDCPQRHSSNRESSPVALLFTGVPVMIHVRSQWRFHTACHERFFTRPGPVCSASTRRRSPSSTKMRSKTACPSLRA